MSHTKRSDNNFKDSIRLSKPYKRQRRKELLKEFEAEYISTNKNPLISL